MTRDRDTVLVTKYCSRFTPPKAILLWIPHLRLLHCSAPSNGEPISSYIAVLTIRFAVTLIFIKWIGSKYIGGHSDLLCGILVVKTLEQWKEVRCRLSIRKDCILISAIFLQLLTGRTYMGNVMVKEIVPLSLLSN